MGLDVKMIYFHVVLLLSSMRTWQVLPVQMSNVIIYPALGKQFMSNHRRNSTFFKSLWKTACIFGNKHLVTKALC